jgi:MFS family permease
MSSSPDVIPATTGESGRAREPSMTLRDVNFAMAGLSLSLFVAALSNLVVLTALPRVVSDLHGTQAAYTWIITASMLTMTVCMPIWGRLSDILDKKRLIQLCVAGYVCASIVAGLAASIWVIILCRVFIGVGAAGIIVLMQSVAVDITTPRHRAKWVGYRSAVMSVATVGAPSLGGFITQHFGWRWCFFVGVPVAILSIGMVQATLRLEKPAAAARPKMDWPGALLLAAGVVAVMLWVSVFGPARGFFSPLAMTSLAIGALCLGLAYVFEIRSPFPMLPLSLFCQADVRLCALAGAGSGVALFGSAVFLAIYLQIGRGFSPQTAGLMALPEAGGTLLASLGVSHFIAKHGRYRRYLICGALMLTAGFGLLSTIGSATSLWFIGAAVALTGAGLGVVSENLVLAIQAVAGRAAAGSAGALVAFFRMLGGVFCVAILGAVLSSHVAAEARRLGVTAYDVHVVPRLAAFAPAYRVVIEAAYAHGVGVVYLGCVPAALVILVCVFLLREQNLDDEPAR